MKLTKERKEMMLKTIDVRLDGIKDASKRTSLAFLIIVIASFALLIAMWNVYFSAARNVALYSTTEKVIDKEMRASPEELRPKGNPELPLHEYNRRELIKEWIKNTYIPINILGVAVTVSDFPMIGGLGLLLLSYWLFFASKRENKAIISVLRDIKTELIFPAENQKKYDDKWNIANLVFHGIKDRWISFALISDDKTLPDTYIFGVKHNRAVRFFHEFIERLTKLIRTLVILLAFLPAITIGLILCTDVYSTYYVVSPFRAENKTPAEYYHILTGQRYIEPVTIENSIGVIAGILTFLICFACVFFQFRTARELRAFEKVLDVNDPSDSPIDKNESSASPK